ncbi:MAG TPA: hypothetical protein VG474_03660, partial [Solirubrobacteraceae bacterium]|nr:hypothetical protein [Solirubrobacteraceae bacterium]
MKITAARLAASRGRRGKSTGGRYLTRSADACYGLPHLPPVGIRTEEDPMPTIAPRAEQHDTHHDH